ncbi:ribosomal biogenesis protein LAS1L isoform X2 [Varanus komodoensis]|uniref:LAS1 like ribosome biogenesis factor n=1 Tax=Varanus komodoensis TaxID=61221 RepID=A0A8D2L023_VARKO|nr:ribosomal biogenesis protein LAS1L isoform X2 [Varanus komodoensis]
MAAGPGSTRLGQKQAVGKPRKKRPQSVVAWQNKAEWDQVMVGLYCGDCQLQRGALDRVSAWKSRYGNRMPLAVECTADLVRCKILDAAGDLKSHELVLTYGLALVRFVNLITERKQKRIITSLRWLAKELDIPVWIVDLRHELTHGKLPHLVACQKGCNVVLEWLKRSYWSRQFCSDQVEGDDEDDEESSATDTDMDPSQEELEKLQSPGCQKHREFHDKVRDVLISYKKQQFEVLQKSKNIGQACEAWCGSSSEAEWVVAQMKDLFQENREVVAIVLLDDGFLIPTTEDLQSLNINSQETKEWDFQIPRTFLRFWQPLLRGLHSKDFTQTLLERMFNELKKHAPGPELRSQYLINWIAKILKMNMQAKKKMKHRNRNTSSSELFLRRVSLQWPKLLEDCLEAPCWASPHLLHLILTSMEPPLPPESQEKLLYLTSIYTQEDGSLPSPGSAADLRKQPVYTVESLQWKVKHSSAARGLAKRAGKRPVLLDGLEEEGTAGQEEEEEEMETQPAPLQEPLLPESAMALAERRMALQGSAWQVSSDGVKWKAFPLGRLPGQTDDPDGLLVENYSMMSAVDQLVDQDGRSDPSGTSSEWGGSLADGLLWTQSDLHKLKSGIQLF